MTQSFPIILSVDKTEQGLSRILERLKQLGRKGLKIAIELDPSTMFATASYYETANGKILHEPREINEFDRITVKGVAFPLKEKPTPYFSILNGQARKMGMKVVSFDSQTALDNSFKAFGRHNAIVFGIKDMGDKLLDRKMSEEDLEYIIANHSETIKEQRKMDFINRRRVDLMLERVRKNKPDIIIATSIHAAFLGQALKVVPERFDHTSEEVIRQGIQELRFAKKAVRRRKLQKIGRRIARFFRRK